MNPVWFVIALFVVALLLGILRAVQGRKPRQLQDVDPPPMRHRNPHWNEQVAKFNESLRRQPEPQDQDRQNSD